MRKIILISALVAILATSACSFGPTTFEAGSYSIDLPSGFYEEYEGVYINESPEMFVETFYFANELSMDVELMSDLILYAEFYEEDMLDTNEVKIDGDDAVQVEYKTLAEGQDGTEYYYLGILTFIKLDEEILIVDTYVVMDADEGIYAEMSDEDRQDIKDIASTIKIIDSSYTGNSIAPEKIAAGANMLNLSDNWFEAYDGENGMYDFGYYALYENNDVYMYYEFDAYNDANVNDLDYIAENAQALPEYSFEGQATIAGEKADIYKYEALDDGEGAYMYGVVAASEHYWIDAYFYLYNDGYKFTDETVENIVEYITNVE